MTKQEIIELFSSAKDNESKLRETIKNIVDEIGEEDLENLKNFVMYDLEIEL